MGALLLGGWSNWPLRAAFAGVALGNLESIAITGTLPVWRADGSSVFAARAMRAHGSRPNADGGQCPTLRLDREAAPGLHWQSKNPVLASVWKAVPGGLVFLSI
ncbi:MAG TPA: hypothetical protein VMT85_12695 [Thermoanaerobaculia bacterium]|nr:hypothetical protein [Thermoanaerobaculia bacterium]